MWKDFRAFLIKDNVVGLAIAVIIGLALNSVVKSLVDDVLMPVINLATASMGGTWQTWKLWLTSNKTDGPAIGVGSLLSNLINFVVIGFVCWRVSVIFVRPAKAAE